VAWRIFFSFLACVPACDGGWNPQFSRTWMAHPRVLLLSHARMQQPCPPHARPLGPVPPAHAPTLPRPSSTSCMSPHAWAGCSAAARALFIFPNHFFLVLPCSCRLPIAKTVSAHADEKSRRLHILFPPLVHSSRRHACQWRPCRSTAIAQSAGVAPSVFTVCRQLRSAHRHVEEPRRASPCSPTRSRPCILSSRACFAKALAHRGLRSLAMVDARCRCRPWWPALRGQAPARRCSRLAWLSRSRLAQPACVPPTRPTKPPLEFCTAPAQQQPRAFSCLAASSSGRHCEVSIVYPLVALFHHVGVLNN
jgi:hypothetical protein